MTKGRDLPVYRAMGTSCHTPGTLGLRLKLASGDVFRANVALTAFANSFCLNIELSSQKY